jgi:hypothetical protein
MQSKEKIRENNYEMENFFRYLCIFMENINLSLYDVLPIMRRRATKDQYSVDHVNVKKEVLS